MRFRNVAQASRLPIMRARRSHYFQKGRFTIRGDFPSLGTWEIVEITLLTFSSGVVKNAQRFCAFGELL